MADEEGFKFEALIEGFEGFGYLSKAVSVFGLVSWFLPKHLSKEFSQYGKQLDIEKLIPGVKLTFFLRVIRST